MRLSGLLVWFLLLLGFALGGCQSQSEEISTATIQESGLPKVVATLSPHVWLANQIGADLVEVIPLMPAGEDPGSWAPEDQQLEELAAADLIIVNGSMLEKWVQRVSLPFSTLDLSRSVKEHWQEYPGVITHSHGPEGERSWEGTDGHFWVDPALLHIQGEAILKRMIRLLPAAETALRKRWQSVSETIRGWDQRLAAIQVPEGSSLLATEPAWGYIAHRLKAGLTTISSAIEEEETVLSAKKPGWILWRSEPTAQQAESTSRNDFTDVIWSPAENLGAGWVDYPRLQEQGLTALEEVTRKHP